MRRAEGEEGEEKGEGKRREGLGRKRRVEKE